jgi:C4-dicarboxylate-specific signal transduction histidine kinase
MTWSCTIGFIAVSLFFPLLSEANREAVRQLPDQGAERVATVRNAVASKEALPTWSGASIRRVCAALGSPWEDFWLHAGGVTLLVAVGSATAWWYARRKHLRHLAELQKSRQQQTELARVGRVSLLGELSASIAHELNQPLTAILSNAQAALRFLEESPPNMDEVRAILWDISAADRRASEVILRIRAMMRKGESLLEPRDLNADIEQVLLLLHSDLVARGVSVITQLAPTLPPVRGDHIQLQQVLLNLILNGCDAMQSNAPEARRLLIATERDGNGYIRVSVVDRGAGIAPEVMERIFEPFYSTKSNGLGMGLSICQAIVKAHGGTLSAKNNRGHGAAFQFTLTIDRTSPV